MKKIFSLSIGLFLILGLIFPSTAAPITHEDAGNYLRSLGIYRGYEDGSLGLERKITRAEFAALAVRIMGMEEQQQQNRGTTVFMDVRKDHWASGYINIAAKNNWIKGYEDQTFRPEGQITYAEALTILIRLLGHEESVTGSWPQGHIEKSRELGIISDIDYSSYHVVNRGDVALFIYRSLSVTILL